MQRKVWVFIVLALVVVIGVGGYFYYAGSQSTVRDFSRFPYDVRFSDEIVVESAAGRMALVRREGGWQMAEPVESALDEAVRERLEVVLASDFFVDMMAKADEEGGGHRRLASPTIVTFSKDGQVIVQLTLGTGQTLATANSERRWFFVQGDAMVYRVFVPLYDVGMLFEVPPSGWRDRRWVDMDADGITSMVFKTAVDAFALDRLGQPSAKNPRGWRVAWARGEDIGPFEPDDFVMDERRIATILDLVAPLYVDDFADGVLWEAVKGSGAGARIQIHGAGPVVNLEVGGEIDPEAFPAFRSLGEGARFVHIVGRQEVAVMTARRLLGILPLFDDLRTKSVWAFSPSRLASVSVRVYARQWQYAPGQGGLWMGYEGSDAALLDEGALAGFVKTLTGLQALRFATPAERDESLHAAQVDIFLDDAAEPAYQLRIGQSHQGLYRLARVNEGPVFVLPEAIIGILLSDLRLGSAQP